MSVPVCPKDFLLVKIGKKFTEVSAGGIFIDDTWKPGEHATVVGTVISCPLASSNHFQKNKIVHEVVPGDEVAFSYSVVYNRDYTDNRDEVYSMENTNST